MTSTNIGRPKKKPNFNAETILADLIEAVTERYYTPSDSETEHKPISRVAEEFSITPLKVRKLLITGGVYETKISRRVCALYHENKTIAQIQELINLSRASVHSYLPYSKGVYNAAELSTDAERIKLYRARKTAIETLKRGEAELWDVITIFAGYPFRTTKGLKFIYSVKGNELFVDRKEKSITRATVELAYHKVQASQITGPKQIGTFGASYLYSMFVRFGIIEVSINQISLFDEPERRKASHK